MASAIVSPLLAAEPFEEAVDGPRSPTSEKEMQLFYEEQGRQEMQRRLSKRNSRKSWRRSFVRTNSKAKTTSEPDSEGYGTGKYRNGVEGSTHPRSPSPGSPTFSPPSTAPATPNWAPSAGVGAFRKPGRSSTSPSSSPMSLPPLHVVRDQSHIPWHLRKYEIYQPPAFGARAPPRYFNYHLLSASARERLQRELAQGYGRALPSLTGSVFSGVGSGMGGSVRSSLSVRRPSFVGMSMGGSAGMAGLETITASPASTAAPLHSPSLDPTSALNNGPAASHRLSTWLKRPPASPHTSTQPLPTDATDLMDGTDPFGSMWHHSSPYDAGEMVVGRPGRSRDSGSPETPHSRHGMLSPAAGPSTARKGPSPLSQSTSAINLTDPEPPLPEPPGSPDLLSQARRTRKLSKRRSTSATRGGLSSLFTRKTSVEDDSPVDGRGGLRGRSRPPLSPSSLSLAQTQGIAFPTGSDGHGEKRPRRKLSKRGRSGSMSSAASMDSAGDGRSIETPIHTQFARDLPDLTRAGRDVEIIELPSAKEQTRSPRPLPQAQPPPRPASQQPPSHPHYYTTHEPPSSAPPATHYGPPPPSVTTNKPHRERKISAASINSFLSRITSRDKDKDKDKEDRRDDSDRKVAPHTLLNHVGKQRKGERGSVFGRIARKLSLIRRRSVDVFGTEANASTDAVSRPSFQVERRPPPTHPAPLQRRATLDLAPSRTPTYRHMHPNESQPQMHQPQHLVRSSGTDLFAPIDPQLRSSRLINAPLSPPPRLDLAIAGDRSSWASLRRHVSNAHLALADLDEKQPPPIVTSPTQLDAPLLPPPPIGGSSAGGKHPDSPHSIPKWGIANGPEKGPALLMNGSPTDDSPMSLPKTVLTIANPDIGPESEGESIRGKHKRESYVERNRALPPEPTSPPLPPLPAVVYEERKGRESVKPLVVRKDLSRSRTPSPVKPSVSGLGSPSGRESPIKRGGRESPVKRREKARESRREMSPVKPIRRTEPLKDHSAPQVFKHVDDVGSPGMSLRTSAAMGSTTSVDAIHGDDDAEFGAKPVEQDANGRVLRRSRASMDSIGKMHVITPKTSLQKIRVRVVSNPPPVEITKESSPVKEDPPALVASESVADSRPSSVAEPSARPRPKSRARSGYTGRDSRQSMYGTAWSESTDEYRESLSSPVGPRKRLSTADPANLGKGSPRMHSKSPSADMHSKLAAMDVRSKSPPMDVRSKSPPVEVRSKSPPVDVRSKSPPGDMYYKSGSADTHYKSASADTHPTFSSLDIRSKSPADFKTATPYMTPTDEHAPLHPFSEKPVAYHNMMAPVVMRVETTTPPLPPSDSWSKLADLKAELMNKTGVSSPKAGFSYADSKAGVSDSKAAFLDSKGAWMDDSYDLPPPKAPFMNEEFSVSKEKLAAQGEFKKANGHHKRESTAESERDRDRERRRAREEREAEARRERERLEREAEVVRKEREAEAARAEAARKEREQERARRDRERAERERERERERQERERLDREHAERAERERQERERLRQEARAERLRAEQERLERERAEQERQERQERERLERERLERLEREREEKERIRQERIRAARQKELELERERERERIKDQERIARERDRERVEKERLERERLELERERIERERAEAARAEWERVERERRAEEMRRQERETPQPPPLIHASSSNVRRARHEADGEREVHVVTMKDMRKASRRRTPSQSRSTSPTSTAPPPPPKDERSKGRQRSQTEGTYNVPITSAIPPTPQPAIEVIRGVPVLPQGTHVEVVQPFHSRPISENNVEAPSLKARDAWERDRLDKGQSVLGPGAQRAVIPDIGSPRPAPDPRQRQPSSKSRSQPVVNQEPYVLPPVPMHPNSAVNVLPARPAYPTTATAASFPRSHNPLPKPPTIDGPFPLHRPGRAYANPNRQQSATARPRNPLPEPPRVSSYPVHHNVSPPRGVPPGAVR